jgi:Domain of unknown function (DUF4126)
MPNLPGGSEVLGAIAVLLTAFGLSAVAGLRAYLPLLAVAVASNVATGNGQHLITLTTPFQVVGAWWFVVLLLVLMVGEFIVDKLPVVDHLSDAFHTIVRPLVGAAIMAGISNPLSNFNLLAAAIVGGALAFVVHAMKAASRPAVTATTAGIGNPIVSVLEDILAVVVTLLALLAPVVAFLLILVLALLAFRLVRAGWRRLRGNRQPTPAPAVSGSYSYPDYTTPMPPTPPAPAGPPMAPGSTSPYPVAPYPTSTQPAGPLPTMPYPANPYPAGPYPTSGDTTWPDDTATLPGHGGYP